jgi:hypothetical protein
MVVQTISFPLVCWGHFRGSQRDVIQTIRALGDLKIIKSYVLLVWSERDYLGFLGLREMCTSIQEYFRMGCDREDLRRFDQASGQLDLGLKHLRTRGPSLNKGDIGQMKYEDEELKRISLEIDTEAGISLTRAFPGPTTFLTTNSCLRAQACCSSHIGALVP